MGRVLQVEEKLTYHERVLDFIKYFFASAEVIHFFPFHSINVIYYIRLLFFLLLCLEVLQQRLDCWVTYTPIFSPVNQFFRLLPAMTHF